MPSGRKEVCVAADTWGRPPRRPHLWLERHRQTSLRNFYSRNFRTASKTALSLLPPSHTAGIVPFATGPQSIDMLPRVESVKSVPLRSVKGASRANTLREISESGWSATQYLKSSSYTNSHLDIQRMLINVWNSTSNFALPVLPRCNANKAFECLAEGCV